MLILSAFVSLAFKLKDFNNFTNSAKNNLAHITTKFNLYSYLDFFKIIKRKKLFYIN